MKKGVALLWVLIISALLLLVSGTMASFIIKDSQSATRIEDSTRAYAAAKSGLDWARYYIEKTEYTPTTDCSNPDKFNFDIKSLPTEISICDSGTGGVKVTSIGKDNKAQRKIEYTFTNQTPIVITPPTNNSPYPNINCNTCGISENKGGFKFQFDFWRQNLSGGEIGLESAPNLTGNYITVKPNFATRGVILKIKGATAKQASIDNIFNSAQENDFYQAVVEYQKNTSVTLTIYKKTTTTNSSGTRVATLEPVGSTFIETSPSDNFGNLNYFYAANAKFPATGGAILGNFLLTGTDITGTNGTAANQFQLFGSN